MHRQFIKHRSTLSMRELTMGRDVRPTAEDGPPDPEGADSQGQDKRDGSRGGRAMHKLKILDTEAWTPSTAELTKRTGWEEQAETLQW